MKKKEFVLLLESLTIGGKTTAAVALCASQYRANMSALVNKGSTFTVDWAYDADVKDIALQDILLNYQSVFGTERSERINAEQFAKILDSEAGKYLKNIFGLEKQDDLYGRGLEQYVLDAVAKYVQHCDKTKLAELFKSKICSQFISRIKVAIPPVTGLCKFLDKRNTTLVLRDMHGNFDKDPADVDAIRTSTDQELGIDCIDAILLLSTTEPFANTVELYKNVYKHTFESVPVFIMNRLSTVSSLYDYVYGLDAENVTVEHVQSFLQAVKDGDKKGFREIPATFVQSYKLLELLDVGYVDGLGFNYNHKDYESTDLRYVYPYVNSLSLSHTEPDYTAADYHLYELIVLENIEGMIDKVFTFNKNDLSNSKPEKILL